MEWIYAAYPSDGDMTIDAIGGRERLNALGRRGPVRRIPRVAPPRVDQLGTRNVTRPNRKLYARECSEQTR